MTTFHFGVWLCPDTAAEVIGHLDMAGSFVSANCVLRVGNDAKAGGIGETLLPSIPTVERGQLSR